MLDRPVALGAAEIVAMGGHDPDDPVLQAGDVTLNSKSGTNQLSGGLAVFIRDRNRSQVARPVVLGKVDGVQTVVFATVARSTWDQARGNHIAMKTAATQPRCST